MLRPVTGRLLPLPLPLGALPELAAADGASARFATTLLFVGTLLLLTTLLVVGTLLFDGVPPPLLPDGTLLFVGVLVSVEAASPVGQVPAPDPAMAPTPMPQTCGLTFAPMIDGPASGREVDALPQSPVPLLVTAPAPMPQICGLTVAPMIDGPDADPEVDALPQSPVPLPITAPAPMPQIWGATVTSAIGGTAPTGSGGSGTLGMDGRSGAPLPPLGSVGVGVGRGSGEAGSVGPGGRVGVVPAGGRVTAVVMVLIATHTVLAAGIGLVIAAHSPVSGCGAAKELWAPAGTRMHAVVAAAVPAVTRKDRARPMWSPCLGERLLIGHKRPMGS
jgi:hypothetical protein